MTNFERYKKTLRQEQFIEGMILNCKGCPVPKCDFAGRTSQTITCEDVLKEWCNTEDSVAEEEVAKMTKKQKPFLTTDCKKCEKLYWSRYKGSYVALHIK